ncbi:MAG: biotin/lipoyl-binding protein, partial [Chloroflexi bacterium]|nr:biotin/lipoyl-binding protein [Chloroflexota bacterium]
MTVEIDAGAEAGRYQATIGDQRHTIDLKSAEGGWLWSLVIDGRSLEVATGKGELTIGERTYVVEVQRDTGLRRTGGTGTAAGPARLRAPIPGLVVAVNVKPGDEVHEGQALIVVEAMKMQMELKSPRSGHVAEVN